MGCGLLGDDVKVVWGWGEGCLGMGWRLFRDGVGAVWG